MDDINIVLPKEYIAFPKLTVCSNSMVNGKVPITFKTEAPLLIGKGTIPLVWLFAPTSKEATKWKPLVEKNEVKDERISLVIVDETGAVRIMLQNIPLVQVYRVSKDEAVVSYLDLRPVGLNVYGDTTGLFIGTNRLANNEFNGVFGMVKIA